MHVTFDLSEYIEETMPQQARKQLETELETTFRSFAGVCCLYTAAFKLVSLVQSPGFTVSPHSPLGIVSFPFPFPLPSHFLFLAFPVAQ